MKMNRLMYLIGTALFGLSGMSLSAQSPFQPAFLQGREIQETHPMTVSENENMVDKRLFAIEQQLLEEAYGFAYWNCRLLLTQTTSPEQQIRLRLFHALAASALRFPDGNAHLIRFLEQHPYHLSSNTARFALARAAFKQQEYEQAHAYYLTVDPGKWNGKILNAYRFEAGLSALQVKDYDRASTLLFSLTQCDHPKKTESTFYYSYIAFLQEHYAVALNGFERIRKDPRFEQKASFFIYSIYYKQGELDRLMHLPEPFYASLSGSTKSEMARMIGEAYYLNNQYKEAFRYFEDYLAAATNINDQDRLMIGLSAYFSKAYSKSIDVLTELSSEQTLMAQQGLYYLGFAFLKVKDDHNAAQAFLLASQQNSSPLLSEESAFNYAKMRLKMTRNPFNEDISSLQSFLTKYPNSTHRAEINAYLMTAYSNSQNFAQALKYMDAIQQPTEEQLRIKQKLNYLYAIDLISRNKLDSAIFAINQCIGYGIFDAALARDARFWKAEALFRQNNFAAAQIILEDFLNQDPLKASAYYTPALYSQAYCHFHLQRYNEALNLFQQFLKISPNKGTQEADATLRIADGYFMQKKYTRAIDMYREALAYKSKDADYGLYQLGFCFGLLDRPKEKITYLSTLIKEYPFSSYRDDALYQRGRTQLLSSNGQAARNDFEQLIQLYPNGALTAKAMVELGLIAMNDQRRDQALSIYKDILTKYPGTAEARNALLGIKNIYIGLADIETYFAYVAGLGLYTPADKEEKDTLTYAVAENFYLENNCAKALPAFEKYLTEFPQGKFQVEAGYFAGECAYRNQAYAQAYGFFSRLFTLASNSYSEQAALMAARSALQLKNQAWIQLAYSNLLKTTDKAELKQEARLALLQQALTAQDTASMLAYGTDLLQHKNEIALLNGRYARMKAYQMKGMKPELNAEIDVLKDFPKTPQGAEAYYLKALEYFTENDYKALEKLVFSLAESGSAQEYWMAKCFILLGNGYRLQGDYFQAKATVQSVLNGYKPTGDSIHSEANEVLTLIREAEETNRKPVQ